MKLSRFLLAIIALVGVAAVAVISKNVEPAPSRMSAAAEKFLGSLDKDQKAKATFDFDDNERFNWNFVPLQTADKKSTRKGLPLEAMDKKQRDAALELLRAGTSETGYTRATTIMALEKILRDLEKTGAMVRNPDWYFFTVFGTPSRTGKWGWRVEGHHLALNFTIDKGKVVGSTPAFFGANPATRDGKQTLPEAENLARELYKSLDDDQKKVALQDKQFAEIEQKMSKPNVGEPKGLPAAKMTDKQKETLDKLIASYAKRMDPEIAAIELEKVKAAGIDKVHFAIAGEAEKPGKPYTYRVQGPTFAIEFLNVQADSAGTPANHIHSSWRNLAGDFGLDAK